ncbi:MAG: PHP domain-containing protein [Bacillota bacterium]
MIKIEADLHTHTIHSGHAYSTVDELAKTASQKGLKLIAVTDHGPNMPDGPYQYYFNNITILPEVIYGVRILKGVEANILDQGKLDLGAETLNKLDFVAAGIHYNTGHNLSNKKDCTSAIINAIKSSQVDMVTHPVNNYYQIDLKKVVQAAASYGVILEVNASSYNPSKSSSRANRKMTLKLIQMAQEFNVYLSLNSDAHFHQEVGDISYLKSIINESNLKKNQVINTSYKQILKLLSIKPKKMEGIG